MGLNRIVTNSAEALKELRKKHKNAQRVKEFVDSRYRDGLTPDSQGYHRRSQLADNMEMRILNNDEEGIKSLDQLIGFESDRRKVMNLPKNLDPLKKPNQKKAGTQIADLATDGEYWIGLDSPQIKKL